MGFIVAKLENTLSRIPGVVRVALALTVFQIVISIMASGAFRTRTIDDAYLNLTRWDSFWYASIVSRGYYKDPGKSKANTAFFPGLPVLAIPVQLLLNVKARIALIITAQACMFGFWLYFLLLLRRWKIDWRWQASGALLIASYPSAYYLVAGYSEPPMLFGMIGYIYWLERGGGALPAALQGVIMTASRLVSFPVILYPLLQTYDNTRTKMKEFWKRAMTALVSSLGAIVFLLSLSYSFGKWNYYWHIRSTGWHQKEVYNFLLDPRIYLPFPPNVTGFSPPDIGRLAIPLTIAFFVALLWTDLRNAYVRRNAQWRKRLPLYVTTALVWYVSVIGTSHARDPGHNLFRYSIVMWVMLILLLMSLSKDLRSRRAPWIALGLAIAFACICLPLQYIFAEKFTHGVWIA